MGGRDLFPAGLSGVKIGDVKRPTTMGSVDLAGAASRYVWEVEGEFPTGGETTITIGDIRIDLNFAFVHERRYALSYLFGFRNPQVDIDRFIFKQNVRPGDVVLDAGANIGVTAAEVLACGAHHVVCVEPEIGLVGRLNALRTNYPGRITVWHCALGATEGIADLLLSTAHNQGHTISPVIRAQFPTIFGNDRQEVTVNTIDHVLAGRPADIWKLDVEGAEADVIRGARRTLERFPPRIIMAELYDAIVDEVINLLPSYRVKRAAVEKANYGVSFIDRIGGALSDEYCPTSPTYVFFK